MKWLDKIDCPEDLRKLETDCLPAVAQEIRDFLIDVISTNGGHFASNLGSVELTVALHYALDTPRDRLIWDVGHQAYPHKILTGRRQRFATIRKKGGLSGFPDRHESEYDHFGSGHASTSISAALGIAEGMKHSGLPFLSVAIIGDGSMTGGLAFEGLNNAGHIPARNLVVVLNDNNMAIDANVGALQRLLNQRINNPSYNLIRKEVRSFVDSIDPDGTRLGYLLSKIRKSVKHLFTPQMLYECLGFRYFGPIDGHDLGALVKTFSSVKSEGANGPYLVHVITVKGKGYKLAEKLPLKYHGVSPFKVGDGLVEEPEHKPNYQDIFGETLIQLAKSDPRIITVTAAMSTGTGLNRFQSEFPARCYDVGIAEEHAVIFGAGLATEGFRPVIAIYSTFLQRSFDQIVHDVALQKLPVIFAIDRAGLVGTDGATHQGQFDLSYLRAIPNIVIMAPKDENELRHMIFTALRYEAGPVAIRYPRGSVVGVPMDAELMVLPVGKAEIINSDAKELDVLLIGIGFGVSSALDAQRLLGQRNLKTGVINARFAKPLDETLLCTWISSSRLVVTVEENVTSGGFGSAVLELIHRKNLQRQVLAIGIPDRFIEHATQQDQRRKLGLDGPGIARRVLKHLGSNALRPAPNLPEIKLRYPAFETAVI